MSRAVDNIVSTFAHFLYRILDGLHGLPNIGQNAKPLYASLTIFLLMGQLLDRANTIDINPDLDIFPSYIGFQEEDVKEYGYFLLFVVYLTLYEEVIWNHKNVGYR
jgi:hypothetical protein